MVKKIVYASFLLLIIAAGVWMVQGLFPPRTNQPVQAGTNPIPARTPAVVEVQPSEKPLNELVEKYRDLKLSDAHNHDASRYKYVGMIPQWQQNAIHRVILFGDVSTPSAIESDENAWTAYQDYPDQIIPYFTGIDLNDKSSLKVVRDKLEQGYFGIGELAAASTHSPVLANAPWKTKHPMDGYLPQIYDIAAKYKAPVLLHIDPPYGSVVDKLEEALDSHPDTVFIFGHINVYNTPARIKALLEKHSNLYADFFAGFTAQDTNEGAQLKDFVPLMKEFPDRFMLSTDSGFGIGELTAVDAMYRVIEMLDDRELASKIAYGNLDAILRAEPATETQLKAIQRITKKTDVKYDFAHMSKLEAGRILINHKNGG